MIGLLTALGATVAGIGTTILFALETMFNLAGVAIAAAVAAAFALLPSMSSAGTLGTPTWLQWLNFFVPVGGLLALLTAGVTMWIAFLAVRYVLKLARAL